MLPMTLEVPDELAQRLRPVADHLPRILELGLREYTASGETGFQGTAEVLEFLVSQPTPTEILALRPGPSLQARVDELLAKSQTGQLAPDEERDWEQYAYLEHLVRLAKAKALAKLNQAQ